MHVGEYVAYKVTANLCCNHTIICNVSIKSSETVQKDIRSRACD